MTKSMQGQLADEWLQAPPKGWDVQRLKEFCEVAKAGVWGDEPLEDGYDVPVIRTADVLPIGVLDVHNAPLRRLTAAEQLKALCRKGDLLVVKSSGSATNVISGKSAQVRDADGVVAFSNFLLRLRPRPEKADARFVFYILQSHTTRQRVLRMVSTTTYPNLKVSEYLSFPFLAPPPGHQKAIADFLDRKTAAIDALIEKKQKLLDLLAEKRAALINQAVTKGLDPKVPMKDSGISWMGEIPAHWDACPLGYCVQLQGGSTPSKNNDGFWNGNIPWVTPKDMKKFEISDSIDRVAYLALEQTSLRKVPVGATLVVVRGMILARTLPVGITVAPVTVNQDMKALVPRRRLNAAFLAWQLRSRSTEAMSLIEEAGHGTKKFRTDLFTKMNFLIPPPNEQARVVKWLKEQVANLDGMEQKHKASIERLQEYRQALITAAVTGQLNIGEEAA